VTEMDGGDDPFQFSCLFKISLCGMMCIGILGISAMEQRTEERKESDGGDLTESGNLPTRPRSNTCPIIQSSTNSRKLKYGSKVIILGTDNVEQRVPQYVGAEAVIVDVPGTDNLYSSSPHIS
jgi:hypothetical protein